jgi:hypothetical protein
VRMVAFCSRRAHAACWAAWVSGARTGQFHGRRRGVPAGDVVVCFSRVPSQLRRVTNNRRRLVEATRQMGEIRRARRCEWEKKKREVDGDQTEIEYGSLKHGGSLSSAATDLWPTGRHHHHRALKANGPIHRFVSCG